MDLPVVIGIDHVGLVGGDGETHHGIYDIGLLSGIPNMIIAQGKDAEEIENLIYTAFSQKHPFAFRYPKGYTKIAETHAYKMIPVGSWEVFNDKKENCFKRIHKSRHAFYLL